MRASCESLCYLSLDSDRVISLSLDSEGFICTSHHTFAFVDSIFAGQLRPISIPWSKATLFAQCTSSQWWRGQLRLFSVRRVQSLSCSLWLVQTGNIQGEELISWQIISIIIYLFKCLINWISIIFLLPVSSFTAIYIFFILATDITPNLALTTQCGY